MFWPNAENWLVNQTAAQPTDRPTDSGLERSSLLNIRLQVTRNSLDIKPKDFSYFLQDADWDELLLNSEMMTQKAANDVEPKIDLIVGEDKNTNLKKAAVLPAVLSSLACPHCFLACDSQDDLGVHLRSHQKLKKHQMSGL